MSDSFFPAARRVLSNPVIKWSNRLILASITGLVTTVLWPNTSAWVGSRADHGEVIRLESRVTALEKAREVNYAKVYQTATSSMNLTDGEQLQWLILQTVSMQGHLTREVRARLSFEVLLLHPKPRSNQARKMASAAKSRFDDLVGRGEAPEDAAHKALEWVYENF